MPSIGTTPRPPVEHGLSIYTVVGYGLGGELAVAGALTLLFIVIVLCYRLYRRLRSQDYNLDTVSSSSIARQEIADPDSSQTLPLGLQNQLIVYSEEPKKLSA